MKDFFKKSLKKMLTIIYFIVIAVVITQAYKFYKKNDFSQFIKAEVTSGLSDFSRDSSVKYSGNVDSYKITSYEWNDALFYKQIKVKKNTSYKISCYIKTENVTKKDEKSLGGAQICITDTFEMSKSIDGTQDWQLVTFMFNSKNRENIEIGFRLGGYDSECIGTAWFSDFKIEEGIENTDTNWNFACLVFKNNDIDMELNNNKLNVKTEMTENDISYIRDDMERFIVSCNTLSSNKMMANYDMYIVEEPLTKVSYEEKTGYYVDPTDVSSQIDKYIGEKEYDHIFVVVRLGDIAELNKDGIDWIGLGGMTYYDIGFSNIRLSNNQNSYTYRYSERLNTFPEEVFVHEFLHSLERTMIEQGYDIPELHDYAKYGYQSTPKDGLKDWYADYMSKNIETENGKIGLYSDVYKMKTAKKSHFNNSSKTDLIIEAKNILDDAKNIYEILKKTIVKDGK